MAFEAVNRHLAVVDSDEVDQAAVVFDVNVGSFDTSLEVDDVLFFAGFGFEETLKSSFAE